MQRKGGRRRETGDHDVEPVEAVLDELYATPPSEFVARREEHAAAARTAGRKEDARCIHAARRPTLAAWAANLLRRSRPEESRRFLELGQALREAHRTPGRDRPQGTLRAASAHRLRPVPAGRPALPRGRAPTVASGAAGGRVDPARGPRGPGRGRPVGRRTPGGLPHPAVGVPLGHRAGPTRTARAAPAGHPRRAPAGRARDELAERRRKRQEELARAEQAAEEAARQLSDRRAEEADAEASPAADRRGTRAGTRGGVRRGATTEAGTRGTRPGRAGAARRRAAEAHGRRRALPGRAGGT
ncbi:hypothetical protein LV779_08765 [Streptomyces thinghirensis]|nr:hypothetical protein [Streptomyces thinghirensis]